MCSFVQLCAVFIIINNATFHHVYLCTLLGRRRHSRPPGRGRFGVLQHPPPAAKTQWPNWPFSRQIAQVGPSLDPKSPQGMPHPKLRRCHAQKRSHLPKLRRRPGKHLFGKQFGLVRGAGDRPPPFHPHLPPPRQGTRTSWRTTSTPPPPTTSGPSSSASSGGTTTWPAEQGASTPAPHLPPLGLGPFLLSCERLPLKFWPNFIQRPWPLFFLGFLSYFVHGRIPLLCI